MRRGYIKNLSFDIFTNFGKKYLSVRYERDGEQTNVTYSNIPDYVTDERTVRKFLNS